MAGRRIALVVAAAAVALAAAPGVPASAQPSGEATDGPGAMSHFGLARKDCVGTARNRASKVWFTVADGLLSDVYFPTVDNTNNETLQFIVSDGATFTDLQARDMSYRVEAPDDRSLSCRVTATADSGRYRIVTDYLADPDRAAIVMRSRFEALRGRARDYRVYVRFDPNLNGNGGGGDDNAGADSGSVAGAGGHTLLIGSDTQTATNAANRDYAIPVWSALDTSHGFSEVANGYAGSASDGLAQLDAGHALTDELAATAAPGNLVQTARVAIKHDGRFRIALGLGGSRDDAVAAARGSLRRAWSASRVEYERAWHRYNARLERPSRPAAAGRREWRELLDTYYLSADYVKAAEDKTFPGAVGAALAAPWGQAVEAGDAANTYFGSYREVFARDLYQAWTALYLAGDRATAEDMTRFLFERQQQPDGSMPRNSLPNGKLAPDSFNTQLDECAFPLVMALAVGLDGGQYYADHIRPAANFVASHGPAFGPERWEEQSGFSPSTLASEIAGLLAAAEIADRNDDHASARAWRGVADEFQRNLKAWTLTTVDTPVSDEPYFIRLSKNGDPDEAISYSLNNGGPTLDQKEVIDAGFLEYARLGVLPEDDADLVHSLAIVDDVIGRDTDSGAGFYRYNGDGYGDRSSDGRPWPPSFAGNGHLWPVLAGERGQYELGTGATGAALARLRAMAAMGSGVGLIPEQAWELPDLARDPFGSEPPETASIGFENGKPAGSVAALTWSAGQFVRLALDLSAGAVLDRPAYTTARYVDATQGETPLTLTSPPDASLVGTSVTVAGDTVAGNTITIAATNTEGDAETIVVETTAGAGGSFSVDVPVTGGTWVINVVATSPAGATGHDRRTVVSEADPGTLIAEWADPDGDDAGPGNYVYPTSSNFKPGAYDLQLFQVFDAGDTIIFRARTRDLTPTFGSPLGAQLLDVYVHVPGAAPASTAASFPQRRYSIEPPGAWSRLIEVQGFGQRYIDASGATLGTVAPLRGNAISRYITFGVPKASLGTPAAGWGFTVVLTGQDGFSPDQARGFQTAPEDFQFGVCAPGGTGPLCTVDPATVPKAVDIVVPAGTTQQAELDYTQGPVTLPPVVIP